MRFFCELLENPKKWFSVCVLSRAWRDRQGFWVLLLSVNNFSLKLSNFSSTVILDLKQDHMVKIPLLCKEGIKGWLNDDQYLIPLSLVCIKPGQRRS